MVHFNFIVKSGSKKIYERYPADIDLPGMIHKVCRTIDRKELATFSITMDGLPKEYLSYVNIEQDVLSISSELKHFISVLKTPSELACSLFFYESDMVFKFYKRDAIQLQIQFFQKKNLIWERIVLQETVVENIETMFKNFSDLIENKFPKAYKIFKAEDFVL